MPLLKAQTLTSYGVFPAVEALRVADGRGAVWHAERPRVEWRRAGGRSGTTPPGQLPPQKRRDPLCRGQ
jgi:hypothetical protein